MPSVDEAVGARSELAGDLAAGVAAISSNQTIRFTKYRKLILPLDGYVFWVRADLVDFGAVFNRARYDGPAFGQAPVATAAPTIDLPGSLHYSTDDKQNADAAYAISKVVFTSLNKVNDFDAIGPTELWIAEFDGLRFAFSSKRSFYQQAGLWHYVGDAVYAVMESQLIDSPAQFSSRQIVSNSLPIWLSMNGRAQQPWEYFANPATLYPAYLARDNDVGPFGAVEVTSTTPIAAAPTLGRRLEHGQQVRDKVRVTLWDLDNDRAMDFVDFVAEFSLNYNAFGFANSPIVRDVPLTQVELGTIAKKKVVEYEINYNQRSARDVARQLILRAVPSFIFDNALVA